MPSTPHSPPETPLKLHSQMAVDNATPGKRTRVPEGPAKAQDQGDMSSVQKPGLKSPIKIEKSAQSHVQVPSTLPDPNQTGKPQDTQPQEEVRAGADENLAQKSPEDSNSELPEFDYQAIQIKYNAAIREASNAEDELLNEFTAYTELFNVWSQAASGRDDTRAMKRLKTRERYVELAEEDLEQKKQHYASVVDAFQRALDLLRR